MTDHEIITVAGIPVEINRKSDLKNLHVYIKPPEGIVTVNAPKESSESTIRSFILRKAPEITKVRERMQAQPRQTEREYVSGEACYLWGKPHKLKVTYEGRKYEIDKIADKIIMTAPEGANKESREKALTEWYRQELKRVLMPLAEKCEKRVGINANRYTVKYMKARWGSCITSTGNIYINLQLVKKPVECLEYVIIHELVHLLESNHTNRFTMLVEQSCPNWREARKLLAEMPLDYIESGDTDIEQTPYAT